MPAIRSIRSIRVRATFAVALLIAVALATVLSGAFAGAAPRSPATGRASAAGRAAAAGRASTARTPHRILVLTETRGYHHASIPAAIAALRRLAAADHRIALTFLPSARLLTAARLRSASAVVFLLTSGELPLGAEGKRALLMFVRNGGGLVGFHSATDTFHHWPAYLRLIGAEFSHHPHPSTERVIIEDRTTPATDKLPPSFQIGEEFYVFKRDPRPNVHVLASLDTGRSGPDRPLVWCRRSGRGRVFYDALAHFSSTWSDPRQLELASGGLEWAGGLIGGGDC